MVFGSYSFQPACLAGNIRSVGIALAFAERIDFGLGNSAYSAYFAYFAFAAYSVCSAYSVCLASLLSIAAGSLGFGDAAVAAVAVAVENT